MDPTFIAIALAIIILSLIPLFIVWLLFHRAPTIQWYCHRCDEVWGYYPGGQLFSMAGDNEQRLETPQKLCFRCQAIMHEKAVTAGTPLAKEATCQPQSHHNPSPTDAARSGILPEVDRIF